MKFKSILLAALAAIAFTACSNDDDTFAGANETKSVRLDLQQVFAGSRGQSAAVTDNSKVIVNNFTVYFVDKSGGFHEPKNADNTGTISRKFTSIDDVNAVTFHFLPMAVDHVIIVANDDTEYANEAAIDAAKLDIANEQTTTNLRLYDEATLTKSSEDSEGHSPLYKATLKLEPRVSRLEIESFKYNEVTEGAGRDYTNIAIKQIFFNNYYLQANLADAAVGTGKVAENIAAGTVFTMMSDIAKGDNGSRKYGSWCYDAAFNPGIGELNVNSGWADASSYTVPVAYNFFSSSVNPMPQLVVWLQGTDKNNDTVNLYLATNGFNLSGQTGGTAITADANNDELDAKVYKVAFEFDDTDLADPTKCVQLTVSVVDWDVVNVTPNFK